MGTTKRNRPKFRHDVVRHAYEGVLERCARLASFGSSTPIETDTDIGEKQEILAMDDLLLLAIYGRRLIDNTGLTTLATNTFVNRWSFVPNASDTRSFRQSESISVWNLLGIIIHSEVVKIVRDDVDAKIEFLDRYSLDMFLSETVRKHFSPKLLIKSDRSEPVIIDILEFIYVYQKDILETVVNICADDHLLLEYDYR